MLKKGDFHIHSTCSDGSLSPEEVVRFAKERDVDIIAISDHNNTEGIDRAIEEGRRNEVLVIPAVELSTRYNNTRVHILGYFKDDSYKNEMLKFVLNRVKSNKINDIKRYFGKSMDFAGYENKLYVETGIELLHFFGASAVLAHPILLPRQDFNKIITFDFQGIEAKYFLNTEIDTEFYINSAKERNMFYTAGSDFHTRRDEYRIHGLIGQPYLGEKEIKEFLVKSGLIIWCSDKVKEEIFT